MNTAKQFYQNLNIGLYEIENLSAARILIDDFKARLKYPNRDLEDVSHLLQLMESNLLIVFERMNELEVKELIKERDFWKNCYQHSLNETLDLSDLLIERVNQNQRA